MDLKPIPQLVHVFCPTCSGTAVAEKGQKILCQNCVNEFLAKNVGLMEEIKTEPPAESLGQFIPANEVSDNE